VNGQVFNWANLNAREQLDCSWEILLGDFDDGAIHFIKILETDESENPIKLYFTWVESGFIKGNKEQKTYSRLSIPGEDLQLRIQAL
ncbi:Hypothetical protein HVR_LOCUS796, partial [uncultured virus]